jgi:3-phenylpropionate/trans-cinnamate dioxygenase ferredoxin reductase component
MPDTSNVTIVGAGHGGGLLTGILRSEGFAGSIRLIGDEPHLPYQRPPLSKKILSGEEGMETATLRLREVYDAERAELMLGERVARIDRGTKTVHLASGASFDYGMLILATGTRARTLTLPGSTLGNIVTLRTLEDCQSLQARLKAPLGQNAGGHPHRLVVVGGGYIGLEVAATARKLGADVTVLEAMPRLMARVATPVISDYFADLHRAKGVDLRLGTGVRGFTGPYTVSAVELDDGTSVPADTVLVGVGAIPNTELAAAAGLAVDNGIVVDAHMRTSDPAILAIGDCTNHPSPFAGRSLRLESVQNAADQAHTAALTVVGKPADYNKVPWFWSDQYDDALQIAGLPANTHDLVVRLHPDPKKFAIFHLSGGRLRAVEAVNASKDYMIGRRLMEQHGGAVKAERLADPAAGLKDLMVPA